MDMHVHTLVYIHTSPLSMSESQYLVNLKAERKAKREKRTLDTEVAPPGICVCVCMI
jgi:hypothetical protein